MEAWMLSLLPNPAARGILGNPGADGCGVIMEKKKLFEAKTSNQSVVIQLSLLKKQNKTTQNIEQPKHGTDLLNHRHKRIKKYYQKKITIARDILLSKAIGFRSCWLPSPQSVELLCCQEHKHWEYTALTGEELRLKDIYPFQINIVSSTDIFKLVKQVF